MIDLNEFSSFFVANWKLNGDFKFINDFLSKIEIKSKNKNCVIICPPSVYLNYFLKKNKLYHIGAQDVSMYEKGSYTGEISPKNLKDVGAEFCIVGHSERRQYFNETDEKIKIKISNLINNKIVPILCIGETQMERELNLTNKILKNQIINGLPKNSNHTNTILAYEPIWAIGSGSTPSVDEIESIHTFIRSIEDKFKNFIILYGGSLNIQNYKSILNINNVNGGLIGGSSLKIDNFNKIMSI